MSAPSPTPCTYFSVDVEASGPVPGLFNLVSLGATPVTRGEDGRYRVGPSFYAEFKPVFPGQDPGANAIHGLAPEHLEREGQDPRLALAALSEFVAQHTVPGTAPTFVGHVAVFDWMYVAWYYAWAGLPNPFGYKGIDTKSLSMGLLRLPWPETGKETLCARLGLSEQDAATVHRADADAEHQARLLIALLERAGI
jgi:DNA polymerase III epsilon subunit-like protein